MTDLFRPPGHFYSPIPDPADIRRRSASVFDMSKRELPGIDLNEAGQLAQLHKLAAHYERAAALKYDFGNGSFSWGDGLYLACMIMSRKPRKIIEIGSGNSTLLIHEVGLSWCIHVDPFSRVDGCDVRKVMAQECQMSLFTDLRVDDILFVDSSHVLKSGSDVAWLIHEVLPRLAPGVLVHFHDVGWPFEYPEKWVLEGRSWNEAHALRAFLQFNGEFKVVLFADYLARFHRGEIERLMPLALKNTGGSLWLRKT